MLKKFQLKNIKLCVYYPFPTIDPEGKILLNLYSPLFHM